MNIRTIFQLIVTLASNLDSNKSDLDEPVGLSFYKMMVNIVKNIETPETCSWNSQMQKYGNIYNELNFEISLYPQWNEGIFIEKNHFLQQLLNIVNTKEPEFCRLLQIALNIGQLLPHLESYGAGLIDIYLRYNLYKPETYMINCEDFSVPDDIVDELEQKLSFYTKTRKN